MGAVVTVRVNLVGIVVSHAAVAAVAAVAVSSLLDVHTFWLLQLVSVNVVFLMWR